MDSRLLDRASETPTPGYSKGASTSGLPADLLEEASRRLGWAGLVYSATFFVAFFGGQLLGAEAGAPHDPDFWLHSTVAVTSIALGLSVFVLSRFAKIRPELLLDLGLIFLVVGAFGISMSTFWGIWPEWSPSAMAGFVGIPWECIWIIMFPMLAPNTPGKTLLASLAAASTGPLTLFLSRSFGATSPDVPLTLVFGYFLATTYLSAGIAFVISRVVYRFGRRLKKAREIGSYHLVRLLGRGGMGEVWLARHRMLARPAAVKLIRAEALGTDEASGRTVLRRFEREAQATAALESYHTIDLYDFGVTEEGAFYYVMELLKGLNLDALVRRFGPVPPARTVYLLRQVCHSLGDAHENGMIHRDIKPANIYVCRLGPDCDFVKVLDFGLVKTKEGGEAGATELTVEGIAAGTPAFMAPEMALGKTAIDGRVDLYALGCVGYWLLTGQRVFERDTPLATVVAHVQEKPVPPSERTELQIPRSLERIIMACLEKDPADRPQSAAELDALLASCMLEDVWTTAEAREWWALHMSDSELLFDEAAAEESMPQEILTVKQ
ncbi:MAG: serine/threonine-protein kinase [Gemmatimonadota bacterium]